jgi:TonB family protein
MKRIYRVMTNFPDPSDAEAARWQSFDQLLANFQVERQRRRRWRIGSGVVLILLIVGGGIWAYRSAVTPADALSRIPSRAVSAPELHLPAVLRPVVPVAVPSFAPVASARKQDRTSPPPPAAEAFVGAVPTGGYPALYDYLARQLQYPEAARQAKVSGTVLMEFTIDTLGQPTNVRVVQGLRDDLDREATRLIWQMPHWTPAAVGVKPVATKHTMPLYFQLTNP